MPNYSIFLTKTAEKQLDRLPENIAKKLLISIKKLSANPRPFGYKKLKGRDAYRIRKNNYRIIYDILDHTLIIEIIVIGHRKEVYKL